MARRTSREQLFNKIAETGGPICAFAVRDVRIVAVALSVALLSVLRGVEGRMMASLAAAAEASSGYVSARKTWP
jgi:hypothetical protein